jgi:hypothetical protein
VHSPTQYHSHISFQIRYDARGHGRSGKPDTAAGYESGRYAEDVEAIINAFGLTKPFYAAWFESLQFDQSL